MSPRLFAATFRTGVETRGVGCKDPHLGEQVFGTSIKKCMIE